MSIGNNTQGLEEVLEMARSLPERSASGGSEADLVIKINKNASSSDLSINDIEVVSGDIVSICESLKANNGKSVRVEIRTYKHTELGDNWYDVTCGVRNGVAHFYGEWFTVDFVEPNKNYLNSISITWNFTTNTITGLGKYRFKNGEEY